MKKKITGFLATAIILILMFSLAGCGDNAKKQEAIDAFNKTSTAFDTAANLINKNADACSDEVITTFQEMSALLTQYKELLEGDSELTDEKYDEMITWLGTAQKWSEDAKAEIEANFDGAEQ